MDKQTLRQKILEQRKHKYFYSDKYNNASMVICDVVMDIIDNINISPINIGLYYPIKGEPDLLKIITKTNDRNYGLPKIYKSGMKILSYNNESKLIVGKYDKIYEPKSGVELIPNIICVPALAYGQNGYRLGFGGGYYDKYLSSIEISSKIIKLGVCFDEFLLHDVPVEKHDIRFDYIITEENTIKL